MTTSRMKRSEGDNASEWNVRMGGMCAAAEGIDAAVVERVGKGVIGGAMNCICSVCAGVMVIGESESIT